MLIAIVAAAVVYLVTVAGFIYLIAGIIKEHEEEIRDHDIREREERHNLMVERNSLLERIQRPEYTPPQPFQSQTVESNPIQDDIHLVGLIADAPSQPE